MQITRNALETMAGPSEWFTGAVYVDTVAAPSNGSRREREQRPLHARRAHRLAHPSERPDDLGHGGHRPRAAARRPDRGHRPGDRVFFEPVKTTGTAPRRIGS